MNYQSKDKVNEKDVIVSVIQDLSKISQKEFKAGFNNKSFSGNNIVETYTADSRREYCQLIDFLSDLLLPHFDEETSQQYAEIQKFIEELVEKKNKEEIEDDEFMMEKLRLSRRLFQHLSLLLHKLKWLNKGGSTG